MFGFLTSVLDSNNFNHKWLSTDYFYFPRTALTLVVLTFSIGKTWNKHKETFGERIHFTTNSLMCLMSV